jgi:hypothetical protein
VGVRDFGPSPEQRIRLVEERDGLGPLGRVEYLGEVQFSRPVRSQRTELDAGHVHTV